MQCYKSHLIYGAAISGPGRLWRSRGIVIDPERPRSEIKRLECPDIICTSSKEAEHYALKLCQAWIDQNRIH